MENQMKNVIEKSYEIKVLVGVFYDIQKIRVQTFSRIVNFVKVNKDKLVEMLKSYSQVLFESHNGNASHSAFETHYKNASHKKAESHRRNASQGRFESHIKYASQREFEIHIERALKYLEEKDYANFSKKYVIEQTKLLEIEEFRKFVSQIEDLIWVFIRLYETEKELGKKLDNWSKNHVVRINFLNGVRGIGPILSSGLIAIIEDISRFPTISKLWKYFGLAPGQKRVKGKKLDYNPRARELAWKIWNSFVKFDCFGRKVYLESKEYCAKKHKDWNKKHIHNWAGRRTVKIFLSCLWAKWRELEGLPTTKPYVIQFLGHSDLITWRDWIEKELRE